MPLTSLAPVSVIIVNYNAGALLAECVAAALAQAAQTIVVDNDSRDDSLHRLQSRFASEPRLSVINAGRNLGFAAGCNRGVDAAACELLLFLNPDCVLAAETLPRLLQVLESAPRIGMVGGLLVNPDGSEQRGGRRALPTPWRSFVRAFGLHRLAPFGPALFGNFDLHEQPLPAQPMDVEAISGALMLVRRAALVDVGGWDEGYFLHCEDLDLCLRFHRKGWRILFVPTAPAVHRQGTCSTSRPVFVEWHKHCGMMRYYRKFFRDRYPGILMWLVLLGVWLRFPVAAMWQMVRRRAGGR